jgi:hypothetical protein
MTVLPVRKSGVLINLPLMSASIILCNPSKISLAIFPENAHTPHQLNPLKSL